MLFIKQFFHKQQARIPPIPPQVWYHPLYFLAFGLGSGTLPVAPGTFGTLVAAILWYLFFSSLSLPLYLCFLIGFTFMSIGICSHISQRLQVHDHPGMCLDEFIGYFVTMIAVPKHFGWAILGFCLFRLFDIWKPGIIRIIDQRVHGGLGMVLDDIVAGVYAAIFLHGMMFLL